MVERVVNGREVGRQVIVELSTDEEVRVEVKVEVVKVKRPLRRRGRRAQQVYEGGTGTRGASEDDYSARVVAPWDASF